jgi:hypothetical protein
MCRKASQSTEKLMLLFEKTFGFVRITYLIAYCIYTAASVMMQDVRSGDLEAGSRMETLLRALRQGRRTCPVLQRSLDIITNGIDANSDTVGQARPEFSVANDGSTFSNYLPAFPYQDHDTYLGGNLSQEAIDFGGSLLDCYPEAQYANLETSMGWDFSIT